MWSIRGGLVPDIEKIYMPVVYPGDEYILQVNYRAVTEGKYESVWKIFNSDNKEVYPKLKGLWITALIRE